ncbi:hypothetical protein P8C59_000481 [Phyllachora maydis]|uniref:Cupin type-2 domain-containing protein n=1 Tax=Phyllachora maydis TaxID=1825666 RepID=A0AAD9M8W7_9PEZI|nr:hypothetical protein P8C59_000481 [Phyllachora maydis]
MAEPQKSQTPKALAAPTKQPILIRAQDALDKIDIGPLKGRILEDGSNTDNRSSTAIFTLPAGQPGPPPMWHEMHDETIYVVSGRLRFHLAGGVTTDAGPGDCMVFPVRTSGTFSNASADEEAVYLIHFTPGYFIHYIRLMGQLLAEGVELTPQLMKEAAARYATVMDEELAAKMRG